MNGPVDYTLEIIPSLKVPEGEVDRPAGCTQDCPHCVFSDQRPVSGNRTITDEVLEALDLTQLAIRGARKAHGDSYSTLNVATGFPSLDLPPLFEERHLLSGTSPDHISFGFGDLSRLTAPQLQDPHLPERLAAYAPFQFDRKPKLHIDYRLPLQYLKASEPDFEKAVILGTSLLRGIRSSSRPYDPHVIVISETVNAYPKPKELIDAGLVEGRNEQIRALIANLFPDDPLAANPAEGLTPSPEILLTRHTIQHPFGVFVYLNRVIPKMNGKQTTPLTELTPESISITFFPDFVWVNHSTYTFRDLSVRFSYDEYLEILKKTGGNARLLKQKLEERILERRAQT